MKAFLAYIVILAVSKVNGLTNVVVYDHSGYRGDSSTLTDLENFSYYYLVYMNDRATSLRITRGTCAVLWENGGANIIPSGQSVVVGYPYYDYYNLGTCCNFNDKLSAVTACGRYQRSSACPNGTFVKKFSNNFDGQRRSYFTGSCYLPSNNTHSSATLSSHSGHPALNPKQCLGAIRGISYMDDTGREVFYNVEGNCAATGNRYCGRNEAVCGFTTTVELSTNVLKSLSVRCCDVGDPSVLCNPRDFFEPVLICDGLQASAPTECVWSQTTGYTESLHNEVGGRETYEFYMEMGFQFGSAGSGLSSNFHTNIGTSNITEFNWSRASSQTWNVATTVQVTMTVPPCTKSELQQVVGSCSFFGVHVNHFKRIDTTCNGTTTEVTTYWNGTDLISVMN